MAIITFLCDVCKKIVTELDNEEVTINKGADVRITCMDCHRKESVWPNYTIKEKHD